MKHLKTITSMCNSFLLLKICCESTMCDYKTVQRLVGKSKLILEIKINFRDRTEIFQTNSIKTSVTQLLSNWAVEWFPTFLFVELVPVKTRHFQHFLLQWRNLFIKDNLSSKSQKMSG